MYMDACCMDRCCMVRNLAAPISSILGSSTINISISSYTFVLSSKLGVLDGMIPGPRVGLVSTLLKGHSLVTGKGERIARGA